MPCNVRTGLLSFLLGRNALADRTLWVTFRALAFIESLLTPELTVFEYGSGGSTIFYSKRVRQVISVEHDASWFSRVKTALAEERVSNCDYCLILPQHTDKPNGSPEDPEAYCSSDQHYADYSFYNYVTSIDSFPDQFFDLVSVDGRARPSCVSHAHRKVKIGGYLVLDNSDRPRYGRAKELLCDWEKHEFCGPGPYVRAPWETTVWKKLKA